MNKVHQKLIELLKSPGDLQALSKIGEDKYQSKDGKIFPIIDGVICLLPEAERGKDLGDAKFYEENPFGLRNWTDPEEVETGVEKEMKTLLNTIPKDALIADIGAGSGRISNYLSMHGFTNVLSVDYSLNSIKMINENSKNLTVWGNNLSLPIQSDAFDLVISTGVIHHTPDPVLAFSECTRIVKPGGQFYLRLRNIHSPYGYLFKTYGAALRYFESHKKLRFLSTLFGFYIYKLVRKIFYFRLPSRENKVLRGKYENLFIKDLITFFNTPQVKKMLKENKMQIEYGRKVSFTHRQHFYVSRKIKTD